MNLSGDLRSSFFRFLGFMGLIDVQLGRSNTGGDSEMMGPILEIPAQCNSSRNKRGFSGYVEG
jgi:hypothetical protein